MTSKHHLNLNRVSNRQMTPERGIAAFLMSVRCVLMGRAAQAARWEYIETASAGAPLLHYRAHMAARQETRAGG